MVSPLLSLFFAFVPAPTPRTLPPATAPTITFLSYPATAQQPFVFTVQSHGPTERIEAQLFSRAKGSKRWTCINWDLSHPERADVMVSDCGVLLRRGQTLTFGYTLTTWDAAMLEEMNCVVNQRADVKIKLLRCADK